VDLSVIIVNWNTRDLLRACLASLRTSLAASPLAAEVIVVDNASADGSAAMAAAEFPEVQLLANGENRNYAAGNNQGLRLATGEFQLLLNPDTEVPPGALEALVRFLRETPEAGAVAPALVYPDGRLQPSVRGFPAPRALLGELTGLARLFPHSQWGAYRVRVLPPDCPSPVEQPMASALLIRKAALEAAGLFDEAFPLFFNDVDLCFRLKQAGWGIWYDPRVRIVHVGGASTRQVRPEAILRSHEGLRQFYRKHYRDRLFRPGYAIIMISILLAGRLRAGIAWLRDGRD
jgi:GT2 family glycosyltransferase